MYSYIDLVIVLFYLIATMAVGVWKSRGIKSFKEYAIADRNYPVPILVATIFATWISSGSTMGISERVFSVGVVWLVGTFGATAQKLFVSEILLKRFSLNRDMISVGDLMEEYYGKLGRIVAGVCGVLVSIAIIGAQVAALGIIFNTFLDISIEIGVIVGAGIIIFYSSLGGIKAVTITDVIQFAILIVVIPLICSIGLQQIPGGLTGLLSRLPESHVSVFYDKKLLFQHIIIFMVFAFPLMDPTTIQRIFMAKNNKQAQKSFRISSLISIPFFIISGLIGLTAKVLYPDIPSNNAMLHFINEIVPAGIKGIAIAGIMAVIMSTVDSYLNASTISFINDIFKPTYKKSLSEEKVIFLSKIVTIMIGLLSIFFALSSGNIIEIILSSFIFWGPVITIPLLAGMYGIRASQRTFILSVLGGVLGIIVWKFYGLEKITYINTLLPAALLNSIVFFLSYYLIDYHKDIQRKIKNKKDYSKVHM